MSSFNLSNRTRDIIKNFYQINPSMWFPQGNLLRTVSPAQDMFGAASIEEQLPDNFGIYDLSKFLGIVSLYNEPKLTVRSEDKVLEIAGEGNPKYRYTLAAEKVILTLKNDIKMPTPIATFKLSKDELVRLKRNISVGGLPNVAFVSDGDVLKLQGFNAKNSTSDVYSADLCPGVSKMRVLFTDAKIAKIMENDYQVSIAPKIVEFASNDVRYYVSPEIDSKYE